MTLSQTLANLGYTVRTDLHPNGRTVKSILRDTGRVVRFARGTLPGQYHNVTSLQSTTADIVWAWLQATEQIQD